MTAADFYLSYTPADRAWAEWIAWQLEEHGYRVLIQAWDMVPGSNWVNSMHEGVQRAERTIAVLSEAYLSSVHAAAEWQAAWLQDLQGRQRKLLVLRVEDCPRPGAFGSVVGVDLFDLNEDMTRQRLIETVAAAVSGRMKPGLRPPLPRALTDEPRFPDALPPIWNLPPRNPHFTGREESLDQVRRVLNAEAVVAVHSLRGMGGVGKSLLAIEYAYRQSRDYDLVWSVPCEQPELVPEHLGALGRALGLPEPADVESVLAVLRTRGRWLLIYDNAEDPALIRDHLPSGSGHVLITTRQAGFGGLGSVLEVDVLARGESTALLRRRLPRVGAEEADQLATALGDHPLALEQASAYLEVNAMPVAGYLDLFRTRTVVMLGQGRVLGHDATLATLWDLSVEQLTDQPAALQILDLCAYLAPEPVPLDLLTRHPGVLPESLAGAVTDPLALAEAVGALARHSLCRRTEQDLTVIHRLLQHSRRGRHAPDHAPLRVAAALLRADLPEKIMTVPESWPRWRRLLPHVLSVCADDGFVDPGDLAWLLDRAATYLQVHGHAVTAKPIFERALAISEAACGPDHTEVAERLNNLATVVSELGDPAMARPLFERAVAIDEAARGPDDSQVASRLNNLASALLDLGEHDEAIALFERVLAIDEAALGPDDPELTIDLNNLADAYVALGQPDKAEPLLVRALRIAEEAHGPSHPHVAATLNTLGGALRKLERAAEAVPLVERAIGIDEASLGPEHPDMAISLNNLAGALLDLRRNAEARTLYERALTILEAAYGPDHPSVSFIRSNIART